MIVAVRVFAKLDPFHLRASQYFYMVVLSSLLMHYTIDGYLFAGLCAEGRGARSPPYSAPLLLQ